MRTTGAEARGAALLGALALAALSLPAARVPAAPPGAARTMAITLDDLPAVPSSDLAEMRGVTDGVLAVLRRHGVSAVGFVNESKLEPASERAERTALLDAWLEAGHDLGNHTWSHPDLQTTPLAEYQQDVLRGEAATRTLLAARGRAPAWFRHPFTHTGPTREVRRAFEAFLAGHGYRVAPFSIENADYLFERVRRDAASRADAAAVVRLRAAYVEHTLTATEHMEAVSRDIFGREIPQVLLAHANRLNADALDEVLGRLAARGYRFVTLGQALADPAWHSPDEFVGPQGPSWLHRFRVAKGLPLRLDLEPDPPAWVLERYREVQAR
jgi:peptidoglycan/xylan/chitin deacetylase (PgdA/CDA1 family)